jgi:hypothetical protein
MNHLDLFIQRHLSEDEIGTLVGWESLVHPRHLLVVRIGLGVNGCRGAPRDREGSEERQGAWGQTAFG